MFLVKFRYGRISQFVRIGLIICTVCVLLFSWYKHQGEKRIERFLILNKEKDDLSKEVASLKTLLAYKNRRVFSFQLYHSKNDTRLFSVINERQRGISIKEFLPATITRVRKADFPANLPRAYRRLFTSRLNKASIVFSLEGDYTHLIRYLKMLEKNKPVIYFDRISIVVKSYPVLLVNIMCHYYYRS